MHLFAYKHVCTLVLFNVFNIRIMKKFLVSTEAASPLFTGNVAF